MNQNMSELWKIYWAICVSGTISYFLTEKERDDSIKNYDLSNVTITVHDPCSPWTYWYEPVNVKLYKWRQQINSNGKCVINI